MGSGLLFYFFYQSLGKTFAKNLIFKPGWPCCDEQYLYIPSPYEQCLHVYTWSGDAVHTFDRDYLQLAEGELLVAVSSISDNVIVGHIEMHRRDSSKTKCSFCAFKLLKI